MHVDRLAAFAALALGATFGVAASAQDDEHFFEPGTKHVCVPAADGRGWNCDGAADAKNAPAPTDGPALRTSRASDLNAADTSSSEAIPLDEPSAPVTTPVAPTTIAQSAPPAEPAPKRSPSRRVPNYLLSPEARDDGAASTPPPADTPAPPPAEVAAPTQTVPPEPVASAPADSAAPVEPPTTTPAESPVAATPVPEPTPASTPPDVASTPATTTHAPETSSAPASAPTPVAETAAPIQSPPPEPTAPAAPPVGTSIASMRGSAEFLQLDGNRFVLELARGTDRTAVANAAGAVALSGGEIYLLRLPRDGSDWYIAAWGEFASIDEARRGRADAIAIGADIPGWPRKIGPLQQEVRRADR